MCFTTYVNAVTDVLSRWSMCSMAHEKKDEQELANKVHRLSCLGVCLLDMDDGRVVV